MWSQTWNIRRIEASTLMFFDPDTRELLRTRPNPLTYDQTRTLRGARPAGLPPRPSVEPVTIQRRVWGTPGSSWLQARNWLSAAATPIPS
jgi:hypothetical protein